MKKQLRMILFSLILIFLISSSFKIADAYASSEIKTVLFLNSYHEGYKWSDDIYEGIKSVFNSGECNIKLQVEYMDTQRVFDRQYIKSLFDMYQYKFKDRKFDLIVSSDDTALEFLLNYGDELFPNTPVVFSGVNYFEEINLETYPLYTGVVEGFDIGSTIDTAVRIHPNTKNIYYVVDDTPTGVSIMKEFEKVILNDANRFNFIRVDGENLEAIINKTQSLPDDSLLLYLIYFKDNQNSHFEYNEAISMIAEKCAVPIYGVWDFSLGHGIIGGKLTSGFYQGETAATMAVRVLKGENPSDIPVVTEDTTQYKFDYLQLKKNNIKLEQLPQNSIVINIEKTSNQQVLMIHSYNKGLKWTDDLEHAITTKINLGVDHIEYSYEYMDTKNNTDPVYIQNLYTLLTRKYINKQFDLIITTDDDAFNFIRLNQRTVFKDTPVLFCGVNYFEESNINKIENITGVVESYDLRGTIDLALEMNPQTEKIIVINDTTTTGLLNQKNLDLLIPDYKDQVQFEIWDDDNMIEIQEKVKSLQKGHVILLLTFNRDKSNNSFTFDESIGMISENARVPIYSVWDFYLGKGLIGGVLTSGITHGETVGDMAVDILRGKSITEIPIVFQSPNAYMFDYNVLKAYNINSNSLPAGSIVINQPNTINDYFNRNRELFIFFIMIFSALCLVVFLMYMTNRRRKYAHEKEKRNALTDALTNIPNRRAGLNFLNQQINKSNEGEVQTTICFVDVNRLKAINDSYGHREGDHLLTTLCLIIKSQMRKDDFFCRLAGDEFLIVFNDMNLKGATRVFQRIEHAIKAHNEMSHTPYDISISYGFAQYNKDQESIEDLIHRADHAMYENKAKK
ncbi:MAG: ABC transporter substrate binding protein [Eubacteriales bacterium]